MEENNPTAEQTEERNRIRKNSIARVLTLRTDIYKKGVVNGPVIHQSPSPHIKLSRTFTSPEMADSGFLDFPAFSIETSDPDRLRLVTDEEEEEEEEEEGGEMELGLWLDTNLSTSSDGTSLSSDGFLTDTAISCTSTPRRSAEITVNEDGGDLRKQLVRKRKSVTDDKDNDQISFLSRRIEDKREQIREIERISKMKIAQIEKDIAADKSEMARIRRVEEGLQNQVSDKRKKMDFPVKSGNLRKFYEYCELCDVKAISKHVWNQHLLGRRHLESLQNWEQTKRGVGGKRDLRGLLTRK